MTIRACPLPLLALVLLAHLSPARSAPAGSAPDSGDAPRVAVFRAPGFPTADAPVIGDAALAAALSGLPADTFDSPAALASGLNQGSHSVLVLPYGSAFPLEAWSAIRAFVQRGGGLVVLGGAPFHQPVRQEAGRYVLGPRQPTFAHELLIGPSDELRREMFDGPTKAVAAPGGAWDGPLPDARRAWALHVRLATVADRQPGGGQEGWRDGILRPLVHVEDAHGVARMAPLLEIDRLRGPEAGGRWVLAPTDAPLDPATIRAAVERAREGAVELDARPVRAAVEPGEAALLRVILRRPGARGRPVPSVARVKVHDERGAEVFAGAVELDGVPEMRMGLVTLRTASALAPGLYEVEVSVPDASFHPHAVTTGFWVKDEKLLASGPKLTVSRDWLRRDGRPMPVIGTTYMASDVHRKFLLEPNPAVWDRDFAAMRREGVNMVRTGLWTGWPRVMMDPGAVDENVLSALDAYVLTAARNGILVCFNFYAFLPPAYGDVNPYLGPRALEGQRALLVAVARRYRGVGWIHYDLINEPSYAPPDGVWRNLPIGGADEARAWRAWVEAKHGSEPLLLRDLWRDGSEDVFGVPGPDEIGYSFLRENDRRPRKVRDFFEFTQEVAAGWAARLRDALRAAGGDVLVTLGQDEGGTGTRPAQLLLADSVDYTAIHTWWGNDDLLWDGVMTKTAAKPNLHQETGLMSLHDPDGMPWRTPLDAARLLDRKFAYAFASRGAGVLQWAWNVNPYQPIDNEATIGVNRPDGTAKPERDVFSRFAPFLEKAAPYLDDFAPEPVALVVPLARLFSGRNGGIDHTKRLVRLLAERHGIVPQALPDIRLAAEQLAGVKLVLVPSPELLDENAAAALLAASRAGTKVLVTGHVEGDSYGRVTPSLEALGLVDEGRPVALHEWSGWGGPAAPGTRSAGQEVTFESLAQQWLRRSVKPSPVALSGNVWHEPLPLEFAREIEPLDVLVSAALAAAGVATQPAAEGVIARVLSAPKAVLVAVVNETPSRVERRLVVDGRTVSVPVEPLRSRLVLLGRRDGRLIAATPGAPVR
jgi:hypothetical protein